MRLKNRFAELVAAHERKTARKWTYEDIARETGVGMSTLSAYANNKVRRFDASTIEPLLAFFKCGVADFFVLEEDDSGELMAVALA
ncbi:MAG: helix-turn-helix transcriptional regulator [Chloroflexi bacterium]|nr:helix-turn-helix transcriptional regulator [Chloroflexota bacterium]